MGSMERTDRSEASLPSSSSVISSGRSNWMVGNRTEALRRFPVESHSPEMLWRNKASMDVQKRLAAYLDTAVARFVPGLPKTPLDAFRLRNTPWPAAVLHLFSWPVESLQENAGAQRKATIQLFVCSARDSLI
jgi:hypothetical protein